MEGDVVGGAAEGDFPDGPRGVVGQVARKYADTELALPVEVEETLGTVDVVEWGEGGDGAIYQHGMTSQLSSACQEQPVRIGTGYKYSLIAGNVTEMSYCTLSDG